MPMTPEQRDTLEDVTRFIYREARLQDEHRYDEWESLWTDDGIYWVPANGDDGDPEKVMSIIYDNRSRIALRTCTMPAMFRHTTSSGRVVSV